MAKRSCVGLLAAASAMLEAAESWHRDAGHGEPYSGVQCDLICEAIPALRLAVDECNAVARFRVVSIGHTVQAEGKTLARATSDNMATRIANALNLYRPNRRGQ